VRNTNMPTEATTTLTQDCEIEDQIRETEEKLDEHAKDIIQALAQRYHDQRTQAGGQDGRSEEELRDDDWYRAEAAFCAALQDQLQQACESSVSPSQQAG
jgi:hypothetical protein